MTQTSGRVKRGARRGNVLLIVEAVIILMINGLVSFYLWVWMVKSFPWPRLALTINFWLLIVCSLIPFVMMFGLSRGWQRRTLDQGLTLSLAWIVVVPLVFYLLPDRMTYEACMAHLPGEYQMSMCRSRPRNNR